MSDEYDGYPALTPEELDALADKLMDERPPGQ